jgi:frataxin
MLTGRATRALLSSFPSTLWLRRLAIAAPTASTFRFPSSTKLVFKFPHRKGFHSNPKIQKGITPGSPDPPAPQPKSSVRFSEPSPLSNHQYHEYSDHYLHVVQARIEEMEEDRSDLETDLSVSRPILVTFPSCQFSRARCTYLTPHRLIALSCHPKKVY